MHLAPQTIALLLGGSAFAGFIDAIVGGGGLIMIPLLLISAPGLPEATALGTNKLTSISGTTSAAISMLRKVKVNKKLLLVASPIALVCSAFGALLATIISSGVMRPLVIALLLAVAIYVYIRPNFGIGAGTNTPVSPMTGSIALLMIAGIGFYDGFFGPGTGTFLIMVLTALLSHSFIHSSAMTKVINASTNFGGLLVFASFGHVWWTLGLALAFSNIIGAQIGARMVINKGTGFVRVMLLIVVLTMMGKLSYDLLT
ncbi:TSUP family transporter [Corynebacterium sp. 4HC-13]|uniref:TSUP family transporter n=1 Tax=Corynebacterium anserum TaxID=2684406 RepID=UPI00163A81DA|nr:TSUP family transporter [Corynebacterium anserum]MBC2681064.1 TSUP family transporter [Corynebacterium anserum]